ncbi:MAG: hypothetical protein JST00_04900 [Deltaproteobacteria bacterium]|nr:hypothetical protein [Deltaproteobacteria bacterium]
MIAREKCVVLVPVAHTVEPLCERGLQELERRGYRVCRVRGHSDIGRGRSEMATRALDEGYEAIMWIDADVVFIPDDVDALLASGHPVVGGVYPVKGQRRIAVRPLAGTKDLTFGEEGDVVEVMYTATGFLLTRREVYERMQTELALPRCGAGDDSVVPYFLSVVVPDGDGMAYLSEDFSFCHRAREIGHHVMVDTRVRLGHVGSYVYTVEDAGRDRVLHASYRYIVDATAASASAAAE